MLINMEATNLRVPRALLLCCMLYVAADSRPVMWNNADENRESSLSLTAIVVPTACGAAIIAVILISCVWFRRCLEEHRSPTRLLHQVAQRSGSHTRPSYQITQAGGNPSRPLYSPALPGGLSTRQSHLSASSDSSSSGIWFQAAPQGGISARTSYQAAPPGGSLSAPSYPLPKRFSHRSTPYGPTHMFPRHPRPTHDSDGIPIFSDYSQKSVTKYARGSFGAEGRSFYCSLPSSGSDEVFGEVGGPAETPLQKLVPSRYIPPSKKHTKEPKKRPVPTRHTSF